MYTQAGTVVQLKNMQNPGEINWFAQHHYHSHRCHCHVYVHGYSHVRVCTRVHRFLYTRVRASGMAVSDLQNTGEFGRFAMPALSLLPLQNNPTRGVRGGTIPG